MPKKKTKKRKPIQRKARLCHLHGGEGDGYNMRFNLTCPECDAGTLATEDEPIEVPEEPVEDVESELNPDVPLVKEVAVSIDEANKNYGQYLTTPQFSPITDEGLAETLTDEEPFIAPETDESEETTPEPPTPDETPQKEPDAPAQPRSAQPSDDLIPLIPEIPAPISPKPKARPNIGYLVPIPSLDTTTVLAETVRMLRELHRLKKRAITYIWAISAGTLYGKPHLRAYLYTTPPLGNLKTAGKGFFKLVPKPTGFYGDA